MRRSTTFPSSARSAALRLDGPSAAIIALSPQNKWHSQPSRDPAIDAVLEEVAPGSNHHSDPFGHRERKTLPHEVLRDRFLPAQYRLFQNEPPWKRASKENGSRYHFERK
jgi:hypothetical protein